MTKSVFTKRTALGTAMAAVLAASIGASIPARAIAQEVSASPTNEVVLSVGAGRMIRLPATMSDLFIANESIADVQIRSANQLYLFGKSAGETTIHATNRAGRIIYSATVRVGQNLASVNDMLRLAMPEAQIVATPMNGIILLTGTVATPSDVEEAARLVGAYAGGTQVINRIKTATPQQVLLKVKIVEVSRALTKNIGVNLLARESGGRGNGFLFGIGRGTPGTITDEPVGDLVDPVTGEPITRPVFGFSNKAGSNTFGLAGTLLGLDLLSTIDLNENSSLVNVLAEPVLAALSGETASFLAGGEFPIVTANGLSGNSVQFKEYGVQLAFTPVVLENGRISMRVRPEVSELTSEGAVNVGGFEIPATTTRRVETTVELGSGQSFMIGGLMRNNANNSVEKAPFLGDIPILGALFRSKSFRRNETELVVIVTPYLVKPVSASQIALPTDGFRIPDEPSRIFLDQREKGRTGEQRPEPYLAPPTRAPGLSEVGSAALPAPATPAPQQAQRPVATPPKQQTAAAAPGFSF
jgi:pilus assembly protein CpaC